MTFRGPTNQQLLDIFAKMVLARTISERAWLLTRQGRVLFSMPCDGQEASDVASAFALDRERDFMLPYARSIGALLVTGMTTREIMLNHFARAADPNSGGRQMPVHWGHKDLRVISMGSPIGVTVPKAAGIALASKLRGDGAVTLVYFGEGAASEGDVHEGLAFAGVHRLPVVFFCTNNGWATSVPARLQWAGPNIAVRAEAYGFPGVEIDGCDVLSAYRTTAEAVERARNGDGPTLIESQVPRMMPHSSADDHTRYRTPEELEEARSRDPLPRFAEELRRLELLTPEVEAALRQSAETEVEEAIAFAEASPPPDPVPVFTGVFAP